MSNGRRILVSALLAIVSPATATRAQKVQLPMVGVWQGEGTVVVPWVRQRKIPVTLAIMANDSVAGTVGDATLLGGWFTNRDPGSRGGFRWNTDYIIIAGLEGPIVRAEGIWRPTVSIPLNWTGAEFVGGFATSGWRVGSMEHRTVEASLVLRRVVVASRSRTHQGSK